MKIRPICTIQECNEPNKAKGYCQMHYQRYKKHSDPHKLIKVTNTNHGMSKTPTWISWASMKDRCDNKNFKQYHDYGGRGITYQSSWHLFENFYADMGIRPDGTTLDRIDNSLGYTSDNCQWSTRQQQNSNRRSKWVKYPTGAKV